MTHLKYVLVALELDAPRQPHALRPDIRPRGPPSCSTSAKIQEAGHAAQRTNQGLGHPWPGLASSLNPQSSHCPPGCRSTAVRGGASSAARGWEVESKASDATRRPARRRGSTNHDVAPAAGLAAAPPNSSARPLIFRRYGYGTGTAGGG